MPYVSAVNVIRRTSLLLHPTHPYSVANLQIGQPSSLWSKLLDDTDSFVAKALVGLPIVLICAADTTVGDLDQCFCWPKLKMALRLDDCTVVGAFEDFEVNPHIVHCFQASRV